MKHEAREEVFALDPYLRKKAKQPGLLRAKVERELRTAPRLRIGDQRPDGMQVQDRGKVIAKGHEVAERPHDDAQFVARPAVRVGDAQLADDSLALADVLLEKEIELVAVDLGVPVFPFVLGQSCLARRVGWNVRYRILLHMRSHRLQVSPHAVGIRPLRGEAKRIVTITDWFRVLVVVIGFGDIADQEMDFACMGFLQIGETDRLAVIEKEEPNSTRSALTHSQWSIGNYYGADDRAFRQLRLGDIDRLKRHGADRAISSGRLHQLLMHRA